MNNSELNKLLKSAPVPERTPEFWAHLPERITTKLHWRVQQGSMLQSVPRKPRSFGWALGAAAVCLVIAFVIAARRNDNVPHENAGEMAQVERCYREIESLFPNQIRSVVFDMAGPRIVLADKADVLQAAPLYLRICSARGCQQIVTFSGQQILVDGDICDVLVDAAGHVMLVGKQIVWSSVALSRETSQYRIEVRPLGASS